MSVKTGRKKCYKKKSYKKKSKNNKKNCCFTYPSLARATSNDACSMSPGSRDEKSRRRSLVSTNES